MTSEKEPQIDELVKSIGKIAESMKVLTREAERLYAPEVEDILRTQCSDPKRIEHLLDGILNFAFDDAMLRLYKKLCRHYFTINPEVTVGYVNAYREMWDEEGCTKGEGKIEEKK